MTNIFGTNLATSMYNYMKFSLISQGKAIIKNKAVLLIALVAFAAQAIMPQAALAADSAVNAADSGVKYLALADMSTINFLAQRVLSSVKAADPDLKVVKTMTVTATAYTSAVNETDDTPCITANGYDLCEANEENVIAANFLKFGTKVRIPDVFGDQIFTVQDRMNARYTTRIDVWTTTKAKAFAFGKRTVEIEVVE